MINVIEVLPHSENYQKSKKLLSFFLGGTIDMGNSINWQANAFEAIKEKFANSMSDGDVYVYNPRRPEGFDENDKKEKEYQINWELKHLEQADIIILNLLPNSKSPISLLELGLFAQTGKLMVICPESFYRYDNVRITCDKYMVKRFLSLEDFFNDKQAH